MKVRRYEDVKARAVENRPYLRSLLARERSDGAPPPDHPPRTEEKRLGLIMFHAERMRRLKVKRDPETGKRIWIYPLERPEEDR